MQIDFHHAVTYVIARLAGMPQGESATVAHASQYVDDATNDGALQFSDGQRYVRVTSAHKMLDLQNNSNHADNRLVWVPFHFLPGNAPGPVGATSEDTITYRMMCKPDSEVARRMIIDCIKRKSLPFALHRFGVALHTYVDTWAHQQFVGMVCDLNKIESLEILADPIYSNAPVMADLQGGVHRIEQIVANHLPVGHAGALTLPDMPFLKWAFVRESGERVVRDNPSDFLAAAGSAFNMVRRFVSGNPDLAAIELPETDRAKLQELFTTTLDVHGEIRHARWLQAIAQGAFSFGGEILNYVESGPGSWKFSALGEDPDDEVGNETFHFTPEFLDSDWKKFHDAVQFHRLYILHELLPEFGLCAS